MNRTPEQFETDDQPTEEADAVRDKAMRCSRALFEPQLDAEIMLMENETVGYGSGTGSSPSLDDFLVPDDGTVEEWIASCDGGEQAWEFESIGVV